MTTLKDHGFEEPLKNIKRKRFAILTRTTYVVHDNKNNIDIQRFIDMSQSLVAREKAVEKQKDCEEKYGEFYVSEN